MNRGRFQRLGLLILVVAFGVLSTGCSYEDGELLLNSGMRVLDDAGDAVKRMVVLWVFGTVLIALATARMEKLEVEVAARPVRSFAMGLVGLLAAVVAVVALCVTVVGIPVALLGILALVFAGYAGACAVLATIGEALVGHKTKNVYVHLGVGCALLLLVSVVPIFGELFTFLVAMTGLGAALATRRG